MSREPKSAVPAATGAGAGLYRVAIVGAGTLKGKELSELLPESSFPAHDVKLLDDDESLGQLEAVGEDVTFVQSVRPENFEQVDFTFFASRPEFTRKTWKLAKQAGSVIIDLSFGLEDLPEARVRSPWLERELRQPVPPELEPAPVVAAHPAAVTLALLLARAGRSGAIRRAVASAFEPASEHGRAGMDELHEQTVNLLSFQEIPRSVFDVQVAFNMVGRYGEKSAPTLQQAEQRILQHLQRIGGAQGVSPSLMLLQAPTFHGHAFSLYLEMEAPVALGDFTQALAGEHVSITPATEEYPSNVNVAGQEDILVAVRADAQRREAFWIWAAADNLRLQALNAVECAQQMAAARPRGKLQ